MSCVYRYIDIKDNKIKYVGIVWSSKRTLKQRINEHKKDKWYKISEWKIQILEYPINSRTDAEYIEAHFVSLYQTDKYYNVSKSGWGISSFIPNMEDKWKDYDTPLDAKNEIDVLNNSIVKLKRENESLKKTLQSYENNFAYTTGINNIALSDNKRSKYPTFTYDDIILFYEKNPSTEIGFASAANIYYADITYTSTIFVKNKKVYISTKIIDKNGVETNLRSDYLSKTDAIEIYDISSNTRNRTVFFHYPSELYFVPLSICAYSLFIDNYKAELEYRYKQNEPFCARNLDRINPEHWYKIIGTDLMINKKAKGKVAIVDYAKREEIIWVVDKEFIIKYGSYMLQLDRLFDVEVIENRIQELDEYLNSKI